MCYLASIVLSFLTTEHVQHVLRAQQRRHEVPGQDGRRELRDADARADVANHGEV
jgi:hypothetical protein